MIVNIFKKYNFILLGMSALHPANDIVDRGIALHKVMHAAFFLKKNNTGSQYSGDMLI
jgi:hypothetical protein